MKKVLMILLAFAFFVVGLIGLLLPVIPQVPFFLAGCLCLAAGSDRFRRWFKATDFYTRRVSKFLRKHQKLSALWKEE